MRCQLPALAPPLAARDRAPTGWRSGAVYLRESTLREGRRTHRYWRLGSVRVGRKVIQQTVGHSSLATTSRYLAHIAPAQLIEAMRGRTWSL